ncbi:histidine phosphatase superfamily [Corynascus novoguineensis]|uniref:Histidine phosphatase superfamily n=1 Tax=Corynascus novoguineensis TaxID=1126955 RepID=A0AAN7CNK5_9PEZI|nr:histidine phosphatase superfamily [Corynascus novoguineensis]
MPPTIILVRHAQALHNVDNNIHDPVLSTLGREQCAQLKEHLMPRIPQDLDVGLIIVSPMVRTIETALLAFGDLIDRGVPIVAHAGWQENSLQPCDIGTPLPTLAARFPQVDFSRVDPIYPDKTSPRAAPLYGFSREAIVGRGRAVLRELRARPEKAVLVVSHSGFLRAGVTGCYYMNADYRVFEFEEGEGSEELRQWEETREGGMGWSWDETVPLGDGLPDDASIGVGVDGGAQEMANGV